jgi:hypothetical protein
LEPPSSATGRRNVTLDVYGRLFSDNDANQRAAGSSRCDCMAASDLPERLECQRGARMNTRRGLFRLWVLLTAIWLLGCIWFGATNWHWFEASRIYEVADTNDEKYRVETAADTPEDEVALFVQKSAGSKWLRKECAKDRREPWCDVVTSFIMPRQYFSWQYLTVSIAVPLSLLMVGSALYWALSGFRRSANS